MPFLRFSRDKRGYEHTYLVHTAIRRGKPSRPRILYWYRTPPGVRVGRKPFDEEVRRTIEAQNPGVTFDWDSFAKAHIPAAEPEPWWERRRAERAARQARRADDAADEITGGNGQSALAEDEPDALGGDEDTAGEPVAASDVSSDSPDSAVLLALSGEVAPAGGPAESAAAPGPGAPGAGGQAGRRRRRRGGRRRRGRTDAGPGLAGQAPEASASSPDADAAIADVEEGPDGEDVEPSSSEE